MSKEVKRYEVTILLDASSSYTVEADSVEAAEHAAWEAHDEASPSLCHQCSGPMDLGDAYGMLIYCDGNEVADTTHDAREIADLRAELDALLAERDALKKDAERLDWLMSQDNCVVQEATSGFWLQWIDEHDPQLSRYQSGEYPSGREAIDAALQGAQP